MTSTNPLDMVLQIMNRQTLIIERLADPNNPFASAFDRTSIVQNIFNDTGQVLIAVGGTVGDTYNVSQAGAVGPNVVAHNTTFNNAWSSVSSGIDLKALAQQLATIRQEMTANATEEEHFDSIAHVSAAKKAAEDGDGPGTLEALAKAGRWALQVATTIGGQVAVAAIKSAIGIP